MTNPAAFKATLVDFKNIRTRKLVQIVFEAPIEDADRILAGLGGYGTLGKESWWAVARMDGEPASEPVKPAKERRRWSELEPKTQAGIRCNEPSFQAFCGDLGYLNINDAAAAAKVVHELCWVNSRAEIIPGSQAEKHWENLESQYLSWLKAAEHIT